MEKIFIFDLDGVIVDTEGKWLEMWLDFLNNHGFPFTEADYARFPGGNWKIFYAELVKMYPNFYSSMEAMLEVYHEYFRDYKIDFTKIVFPHVQDLIIALHQRGYTLVIASSSPYQHIYEVCEMLDIKQYFSLFVSGYDFTESKPNPEIYNFIAKKLNVVPEECWVLEDSTYGIQAAKAANMRVIGRFDDRYGYDQSPSDYLVHDVIEVLEIVDSSGY